MYIATLSWLCIMLGYVKRYELKKHIPLVLVGIGTDILLVLYLEVTRSAIATAAEFSLKPLQQIHILFSTIALLLYFPTMYYGFKMLITGERGSTKKAHMKVAKLALFFRSLGFIFMFSMWGLHNK